MLAIGLRFSLQESCVCDNQSAIVLLPRDGQVEPKRFGSHPRTHSVKDCVPEHWSGRPDSREARHFYYVTHGKFGVLQSRDPQALSILLEEQCPAGLLIGHYALHPHAMLWPFDRRKLHQGREGYFFRLGLDFD